MSKKIKGPNRDTVAATNYQYLDLPKSMEECFYDLELVDFKLTENEDKYVAVFKILDTDTKLRKGTEISHMMDPYQKFASTYFWRDVFTIYCVCGGKEADKEHIDALVDKSSKVLARLTNGKRTGGSCTVRMRRYEGKDDKPRTHKDWAPLSESEDD